MYRVINHNSPSGRIALLARQQQTLFHTKELGLLWHIEKPNTLHTLLKRYTQKKLLFRIYKGFYSLLPLQKLDPYVLGAAALHGYAYVSTETILAQEGIIPQIVYSITFISSHSRKFKIGSHSFISRRIQDKFLFNPTGITEKNGILQANVARAVADLFYFNPKAHLDGLSMVNLSEIQKMQKEIGYPLTPLRYAAPKTRRHRS